MYKGYGLSSYACSCSAAIIISVILSTLVIIIASHIGKTNILSDRPLLVAYPIITFVLWVASWAFIFTPGDAYRFIRFYYRDFWQSGKDIWNEKK